MNKFFSKEKIKGFLIGVIVATVVGVPLTGCSSNEKSQYEKYGGNSLTSNSLKQVGDIPKVDIVNSPTPIVSVFDKAKELVNQEVFSDKLISVNEQDSELWITCKDGDYLSVDSDLVSAMHWLTTDSRILDKYKGIRFNKIGKRIKDKYANEEFFLSEVIYYKSDTIRKINFNNFSSLMLEKSADEYINGN